MNLCGFIKVPEYEDSEQPENFAAESKNLKHVVFSTRVFLKHRVEFC